MNKYKNNGRETVCCVMALPAQCYDRRFGQGSQMTTRLHQVACSAWAFWRNQRWYHRRWSGFFSRHKWTRFFPELWRNSWNNMRLDITEYYSTYPYITRQMFQCQEVSRFRYRQTFWRPWICGETGCKARVCVVTFNEGGQVFVFIGRHDWLKRKLISRFGSIYFFGR